MTNKTASRKAKIEAAAQRRDGGGGNRIAVATVVVLVVIAAVVTAVILGSQSRNAASTAGGASLPTGAMAMGAGIVVNPDAPADAPTMDLYVDYQCPACARFEHTRGREVTDLATRNEVRLVVHTLSFLDDNLGNDSSNRAANAAACAADQGRFLPYHNALFAGQPAQEGQGYTEDQLKAFAATAGITGSAQQAWQHCYDKREHNQYVHSVQTQSEKDGINQTPTIKLGGRALDLSALIATGGALTAAAEAANE